jgi:hypothetical protein
MAGCIKRRDSGSVQVPDGGNDFDGVSIDIREGKDGGWSDAVFQGLDGLGIHTENKSWLPIRSESGFLVRQWERSNSFWKIGVFLCLAAVALLVFGDRTNLEDTLPLVIFFFLIGTVLIVLSLVSTKS